MLVGDLKPWYLRKRATLPSCLPDQYCSNHIDHDGCYPVAEETLVGYRQMRALIETLDPFDQFESSAAHLMAIMAFGLDALSLP